MNPGPAARTGGPLVPGGERVGLLVPATEDRPVLAVRGRWGTLGRVSSGHNRGRGDSRILPASTPGPVRRAGGGAGGRELAGGAGRPAGDECWSGEPVVR